MRFCNLTPFLPLTKLVSLHPPQPEMMIVVRASYRVGADGALTELVEPDEQGSPAGDTFTEEARGGECIHATDLADFKLRGEVLLRGHAHAPAGEPVASLPVRLTVGDWSKTLRVVGERRWERGATGRRPSEPSPFAKMPLRWSHAFGGPGFADNPVGRGHGGEALPCLEYPDEPMTTPGQRIRPASFGPLHPDWPARASKQGTRYGGDYRKKRAPFYAEDFDWSHFNAAPADQRLEGYLRGDEALAFHNLHPDAPVVKTALPGAFVRVFVKERGEVREVPVVIDTLLVDLDERRIHVSHRGVTPVRSDDFDEVETILVAKEVVGGRREPLDHYVAQIERYEADPSGLDDALATVRELVARQADDRPLEPDEATGNPVSDVLKRKLGSTQPALQAKVLGAIEDARREVPEDRRAALEERLAEAAQAAEADVPPPRRTTKPGRIAAPNLRAPMRKVLASAAEIREKLAAAEAPSDDLFGAGGPGELPEGFTTRGRGLPEERRRELEAALARLEAAPHDPHLEALDPEYEPPLEPLSDDEPGPGCDLREHDLSDRDLSGMDLSGARFDLAVLCRTSFRGCNLRGASFHRAVLYKADLTGADLTGATLTQVTGARLEAREATLVEARLDEAFLEDATLERADLSGATGEHAIFTRANLRGARLERAVLPQADFTEAALAGAKLAGAALPRGRFEGATAPRIDLAGADLAEARWSGADLSEARAARIVAPRSQWREARLDGADLTLAQLPGADLTKASARRARLVGADLREARLYRTDLAEADLERANLFQIDGRKAHLSRARLVGANLYGALLLQAAGRGADLKGAILTRSTLLDDA